MNNDNELVFGESLIDSSLEFTGAETNTIQYPYTNMESPPANKTNLEEGVASSIVDQQDTSKPYRMVFKGMLTYE